MWVPLVALAIFATIGGFVGVGPAFKFLSGSEHPGGRLNIVNYLDPIIWNSATGEIGREHASGPEHVDESAATAAPSETRTAELVPAEGEIFKKATSTHEEFNHQRHS